MLSAPDTESVDSCLMSFAPDCLMDVGPHEVAGYERGTTDFDEELRAAASHRMGKLSRSAFSGFRSPARSSGGGGEDERGPSEGDLTAYRERAARLLEDCRLLSASSNWSPLLTRLFSQLELLVEDLASIAAPESAVQPLRALLENVRRVFAAGCIEQQAAAAWDEAQKVLEAFTREAVQTAADSAATASSPPRKPFWK